MRPSAPDFKTYIFGILAQFVTIWHQQKRWVFFFDYGPLQDPCVQNFELESIVPWGAFHGNIGAGPMKKKNICDYCGRMDGWIVKINF